MAALTEGGTDAAESVLGPVHLMQSFHCILGKIELQMTDESKMPGLPNPAPACSAAGEKWGSGSPGR